MRGFPVWCGRSGPVFVSLSAPDAVVLQDGRDGRAAASERPGGIVRFIGGAVDGGDGGQAQRGSRHPRDVVQASGLLVASSWSGARQSKAGRGRAGRGGVRQGEGGRGRVR